jgi:hypothetical protein
LGFGGFAALAEVALAEIPQGFLFVAIPFQATYITRVPTIVAY